MAAVKKIDPKISVEEYLAQERVVEQRHEYVNGYIYAMSGASRQHNTIAGSLYTLLNMSLPNSCDVFIESMKVYVKKWKKENNAQIFYYPDIVVSCQEGDDATYYLEYPVLIIEVLSKSTAAYDRYEKFKNYKSIPTLHEYVLISQQEMRIEVFRKRDNWNALVYKKGEYVTLACVDLHFKVEDLYRRVRWNK